MDPLRPTIHNPFPFPGQNPGINPYPGFGKPGPGPLIQPPGTPTVPGWPAPTYPGFGR